MSELEQPRPVVLCVLDGWGYRRECADNAVCQGHLPVWQRLLAECPHALLDASAHEVGLPPGQMGNSEVGHMNIGAGRICAPELTRIDRSLADGSLARNPNLESFIAGLKASKGRAHLLGLLSPGGVHSHQDQLAALARLIAGEGIAVSVHAFLDGRDTPPRSALDYVAAFAERVADLDTVRFATIAGRYYAMDRDQRWERLELAYRALAAGEGLAAADAASAIREAYARGESDEFVKPTALGGYRGMAEGDGLLMGNFRADRVRQLLSALLDPAFAGFTRSTLPRFAAALGMVEYSQALNRFLPALFEKQDLSDTLGEVVARAGLKQLRIAETEKYAHVTFFFNGGEERPFPGEERVLVPSPKVATYDEMPEMSAEEVTDRLVAAIQSRRFALIVVNYANGDMVGHSGILAAAIRAAETIDQCLGRLESAVRRAGSTLLITADHGNLEEMRDPVTGQPHTAHTLNPVPILLVNGPAAAAALSHGRLADVAPTVLRLMGLPQPAAMTGKALIRERAPSASAAGNRASA